MTQQRILIIDDNKVNVELLKAQLKRYPYDLEVAYDGEEGLAKIHENPPDLILLDLMMPKVSGYEVCRTIKQDPDLKFIPVIVITALSELDDKIKAIELGADDFLIKPFNKLELSTRIASLLKLKLFHDDLDRSENILFSLVKALEAKDLYTRGHSGRVSQYSVQLARELNLPEKEIETIRKGTLLHDIGKIGVREDVLLKPGNLTAEEIEHIREHPVIGYDICKPLKSLAPCLPIIRSHHERFDGRGYPDQLKGENIPLAVRITSVADCFDAMNSNRPFRTRMERKTVFEIFDKEQDSGQWDPELVDVFLKMMRNMKEKV